jgi:hypothetical protein
MKKFNYISLALVAFLMLGACEQEVIELTAPDPDLTNITPDPCGGNSGQANFSKFIAIGNSFVAGVQGGALFTEGQNNSMAALINNQLACAGGSTTFNQPSIRASLGWNLFFTQPFLTNPSSPVLGRLRLQGNPPRPTPQAYAPGNLEAVPNPTVNPPFQYAGSPGAVATSALNNFSVPAILLGQALTPAAGNWANPNPALGFTPFYARFASAPGTSTILGDAISANSSFFLFWLGLDDFFLHAAFGGDGTLAPLTSSAAFQGQYQFAIGTLLASNANLKGVVGNFPNIFVMPHFTSVPFNPIPLDAATAGQLNAGFAGYNAALDGLKNPAFGGSFGTAEQLDARKITFAAGNNRAVLNDESIPSLAAGFDALLAAGAINDVQRAQLAPYERVRQTTSADILPLSTGSILGTIVGGNPQLINGLTVPLADRFVLIPTEIQAINNARTAFNNTIQATVTANDSRLALADVNGALNTLVGLGGALINGVTITPNINPPTGIYSEDGVHYNTRGYAFLSNVFIQAINTKFGASAPLVNISRYQATGLPIQ